MKCGGDINYIFATVPFLNASKENEKRIREVIKGEFKICFQIEKKQ